MPELVNSRIKVQFWLGHNINQARAENEYVCAVVNGIGNQSILHLSKYCKLASFSI